MNYFEGAWFFLVLGAALIPAVILGLREKPLGPYALFLSILFAGMIFGQTPLQLLYLAAFCAWSFALVRGYLRVREKTGRKACIYHAFVLASLVPLAQCKISPLFSLNLFGFTGISYLTFRVIQIIIETYDGVITGMSADEFLSFLLFFPTLSSGPIDRSRRFLADAGTARTAAAYQELLGRGLWKLLLGAVYKFVISAWVYHILGYLEEATAWYLVAAYGYVYGVYLFFDFAGYSLMAVGVSYILGVETPDNFRGPFLSRDIREFWDRWHISLSHWFRDYIFTRFVMYAAKKKWFRSSGKAARTKRACLGFLVNMGIMGIWHGLTAAYILYGLYHGLLLAGFELYTKYSAFYRTHREKTWYQALSWFVTMQLVMFGFLIFSGKLI